MLQGGGERGAQWPQREPAAGLRGLGPPEGFQGGPVLGQAWSGRLQWGLRLSRRKQVRGCVPARPPSRSPAGLLGTRELRWSLREVVSVVRAFGLGRHCSFSPSKRKRVTSQTNSRGVAIICLSVRAAAFPCLPSDLAISLARTDCHYLHFVDDRQVRHLGPAGCRACARSPYHTPSLCAWGRTSARFCLEISGCGSYTQLSRCF